MRIKALLQTCTLVLLSTSWASDNPAPDDDTFVKEEDSLTYLEFESESRDIDAIESYRCY